MQKDIRESALYQEAEELFNNLRRPGTGQISDAVEVSASPNGRCIVYAATIMDTLQGAPPTRIAMTDVAAGDTRVLTFGPNTDRSPKFSPSGREIAFLSDRCKKG